MYPLCFLLRVRVCLIHFHLQLQSNRMRDIISPWGLFNNTCSFTISILHPIHVCIPLPIPCSRLIPGHSLTTTCVLLTLNVVIIIPIARTAPSTTWLSGFRPNLTKIMLINYFIRIQHAHSLEVAGLVQPAAWWLDLRPQIIATIPWDTLSGACNLHHTRYLWIGAIDLIPDSTGVVTPPIGRLVVGLIKHLPHISVDGCPPNPNNRNLVPEVRQHWLELWKVVSCDWIKKEIIIKEIPWPSIFYTTKSIYPYESTDVFHNDMMYTVPIQLQASVYN